MRNAYSLLYEYQDQLLYGCVEDFCTCCVLRKNANPDEVLKGMAHLPSEVIDFHYLNVIAGLTKIDTNSINTDLQEEALYEKLLNTISDDILFWQATFFVSTEKTKLLAKQYGLGYKHLVRQPLHPDFMNAIIQIYSDFETLTQGCEPRIAQQRIAVAERVIKQLTSA